MYGSDSEGSAFRVVAMYIPTEVGLPNFFRYLGDFPLNVSLFLMFVDDRNAILESRLHRVVLADRRLGCKSFTNQSFLVACQVPIVFPKCAIVDRGK